MGVTDAALASLKGVLTCGGVTNAALASLKLVFDMWGLSGFIVEGSGFSLYFSGFRF